MFRVKNTVLYVAQNVFKLNIKDTNINDFVLVILLLTLNICKTTFIILLFLFITLNMYMPIGLLLNDSDITVVFVVFTL